MPWYNESVFYHIYPLGLSGAPEQNSYGTPEHRLNRLIPWIAHIREIGCTALYIGPLFESVGHGYETTDYRRLDSRLGTNEDLKAFVKLCHESGVRVILDGVFNHTGRDFFAFRDLRENRERSRFRDWYCRVDFGGNNEYGDGFSYENWGGYNLLPKLNLANPEVREYHRETVRFWVSEFDIDGLRLDAADVLDFTFMRELRELTDGLKPDFWLMGEVIHGDYGRWANERTLHSVTNYHLHKALYSAHNDHNYFEIAHTVKRQMDMGLRDVRLYSFVDNHDVERIMTKLRCKAHYMPVHVLLYTLPGIPSVYYGSEFGIEGRKERGSDASLRPCLDLEQLKARPNACLELISALGRIHQSQPDLVYGDYRELQLTTTAYAFARGELRVTVNNDGGPAWFDIPGEGAWTGALSGRHVTAENGRLRLELGGNSGEIWIPDGRGREGYEPLHISAEAQEIPAAREDRVPEERADVEQEAQAPESGTAADGGAEAESSGNSLPKRAAEPKPYEEMTVEELQAEILEKLASNGPLTDRMRRDVLENVYPNSLLNWIRSFQ